MGDRRAGRALSTVLILMGALGLGGCATLVEGGSSLLDGSAFREKELARWGERKAGEEVRFKLSSGREISALSSEGGSEGFSLRRFRRRDGEERLSITQKDFPFLRIDASLPGEEGSFRLLGLEFLGSHEAGWNEFTLDLAGSGSWTVSGDRGKLRVESLEMIQISRGKIRYKEERLGKEEALRALRNRYERISALTAWMREREEPRSILSPRDFERRWKGELLPEMVGEKRRPPAFKDEGDWVRAEEVRWNAAYTRALFPEDLWPLRDTGALLRDWEEALPWIRLFYHWDYLADLLTRGLSLEKINSK